MNRKTIKHIPKRMCAACNQMKEKKDLFRIVKVLSSDEKNAVLDTTGKAQGRGIYVCKDLECLKKFRKNKRLERTFRISYNEAIYEQLEEEISSYE